ncbi:MAG: c-type cytochrome [Nitrospinales bacterium]
MIRKLFLYVGLIFIISIFTSGNIALAAKKSHLTEEGIVIEPICPQVRNTEKAPEEFYNMKNPLKPTPANIFTGQTLFHFDVEPVLCRVCHGISGNGLGILIRELSPGSRNFTCARTMNDLPDGQLFWIIRNGSKGTAMPAFKNLKDEQIWHLILYIRSFTSLKP